MESKGTTKLDRVTERVMSHASVHYQATKPRVGEVAKFRPASVISGDPFFNARARFAVVDQVGALCVVVPVRRKGTLWSTVGEQRTLHSDRLQTIGEEF
jgi:hypothetical protein